MLMIICENKFISCVKIYVMECFWYLEVGVLELVVY